MSAAPVSAALEAEAVDELSVPVSAGPSQCQWSPWGSQPTDSVGLGEVGVALVVVSSLEDADADVVAVADAGPSQCLAVLSAK
jgi:hypothetical protein